MPATIQHATDSAQEFTGHFVDSAESVFSKVFGWQICLSSVTKSKRFQTNYDICGFVGFSGTLHGTILIGIGKDVAIAAAEALFGTRPTTIDPEIMDMVGELANLIGGNAKERLPTSGVILGLPTVVCGKEQLMGFAPGSMVDLLSFSTPHGPFSVEVAIRRIHCCA